MCNERVGSRTRRSEMLDSAAHESVVDPRHHGRVTCGRWVMKTTGKCAKRALTTYIWERHGGIAIPSEPAVDHDEAVLDLVVKLMLRGLVDVVSVPCAGLLGLDVVFHNHISPRKGSAGAINGGYPVIGPPVAKGFGKHGLKDIDVGAVDKCMREDPFIGCVKRPRDA